MRFLIASAAVLAWSVVASADPSFDCHTDTGLAEQTICAYPDLARLDSEMAQLYFSIANNAGGRYYRRLKREQRRWLDDRDDCGADVGCLRFMYQSRIRELSEMLGD